MLRPQSLRLLSSLLPPLFRIILFLLIALLPTTIIPRREEDEARQRRGGRGGGGGGGGGGRSVKSPRPTSQKSSLAFSIFRLRWRWQEEGTRAEAPRHASRSNSRIDFSQSKDVPLKSTGSSGQHTCVFRFRPALCTLKIRARPRARTDTLHSGAKSIFLGSFLPSRARGR